MSIVVCNNNSLSAITSIPASITGGALNLISTQTASSSSTISFTSGIDSTYKEYIFKFINIHPATDDKNFQINFRDGGSDFDATKTTTMFRALHSEDGGTSGLAYRTGNDLAQSTSAQDISEGLSNDADHGASGTLHLFDPSSTTFIKHFIATTNGCHEGDITREVFTAGYFNTTTALTRVRFKFDSGDIDSGTIKMYGVV